MAARTRIESVSLLATIPHPLDPEQGRILLSTVSSFTKSKKRKRFEIAACIDGEAVNIYSVENTRLLSSYSVPPQTRFLSEPCSVVVSQRSDKSSVKNTYVATTDGSASNLSLLCFEERSAGSDGSTLRKLTRSISSASPVILIEAINLSLSMQSRDESYQVLILRQDGALECVSKDLEDSHWTENVLSTIQASSGFTELEVQHAIITTASNVKTGFLENRPDVAAVLEGFAADDDKSLDRVNVICIVSRTRGGTDLFLSLVAIRPPQASQLDFGSKIQDLVTWSLPEHPAGVTARLDIRCSFNMKLGFLHVGTSDVIATYNFTENNPKITSIIADSMSSLSSQIALPGSIILAASRSGYTIYDVKYNSVQDRRDTNTDGFTSAKKRKRDADSEVSGSVRLIEYFSKTGIAVALRGRDLSLIQLAHTGLKRRKREQNSCQLIDALGRGVDVAIKDQGKKVDHKIYKLLGPLLPDSSTFENQESWNTAMGQLEDLANKEDVDGFDQLFAEQIGIRCHDSSTSQDAQQDMISIYEDAPNTNSPRWIFPDYRKSTTTGLYRSKATFALRLIFQWSDKSKLSNGTDSKQSSASPLTIQFFPPNVFHWLVITGQLSKFNIEQAFRLYPSLSDGMFSLSPFDLIDAIAHFDPSLRLLFGVITHHLHLEALELVQAIKYIIQSLDDSEVSVNLPAITNGEEPLLNGDGEHNFLEEADDAVEDVDFVISTLEHGIPMRGEVLRTALTQLNAFSVSDIVDAFRASLNQHEIVRLMNILRLELEDSGWISRYIDPDPTASEYGIPSNHAITIISRVLSCAVDAIGLNGWLSTSASDPADSMDGLLIALRSEASIALEGIHEAMFMIGLLNQFLHYAYRRKGAYQPKPGKPITIEQNPHRELPLGLKIENEISLTRVSAGGREQQRSKRDIGRQISMKVPKYSFERIRI